MKTRYKYFGWSILVTIVAIVSCILLLSAGWLFLFEVWGHYAFLVLAALLLVLRLTSFVTREHFIYILIGTINFGIGVGAFCYYFTHINPALPIMMSINFTIGAIMLFDALLLKRKKYEENFS